MTNFIPIFPLSIVVFPGEQLNLHIFEERYKQLINECHTQKKAFGIPSVINDSIGEMGTLVKISEIVEVYDDGRMDMRAEGVSVFRILEVVKQIPDKLYSGAIVHYAGLTVEEEYELLGLLREDQRLEYLKRHLQKILPMVAGIEAIKDKIQLNGHFRELKGFNL